MNNNQGFIRNDTQSPETSSSMYTFARIVAGLGAMGVALQNYPAVVLCLTSLSQGIIPPSTTLNGSIQLTSLSTGGLCSGMVNFLTQQNAV